MAEEEEVMIEIEALKSVYGEENLVIIQHFPPHFQIHLNPRTAEDITQQFVEAVIGVRASLQYPYEPPHVDIIDSKGLDEKRNAHIITSIREKAKELSSCMMLIALCEEVVEMLSNMNHPEGDCPMCLDPLLQDLNGGDLPFMKLMSCFHCFHSKCITRWWKWLQEENSSKAARRPRYLRNGYERLISSSDLHENMTLSLGNCPVCRKVFHAKDIEHVIDLVSSHSSQPCFEDIKTDDDEKILHSEAEVSRRQKFEALLKLQEENSGLIEPKVIEVLMPGVFLPVPEPEPEPELVTVPTESAKDPHRSNSTGSIISKMGSSRAKTTPSCKEQKRST